MQYDDELERMRARKRQSTRKQEPKVKEDGLDIIDLELFDDTELKPERPDRNQRQRSAKRAARELRLKKKRRKRRRLLIGLLVLAALAGGLFYYFKTKVADGYWTIAIFGLDSRDGRLENGALSDVEMICSIDRKTGEMKLVSVFRDTYLEIDGDGTYHKINEAYFKGGHEQAVDALERNLDLKIDDYVTFNWKAVADAINILGGIDIEITDSEFKYINGFITATVESTGIGSHHLKQAGMNHLDGVQAVSYARLRLMDTDYNRTARQRKVIELAMEKAKAADFSVLNNILVTVLPQTSTSVGIDDLIPIAKNVTKYHLGATDGFPFSRGETKISKRDCVIPLTLESNVSQLHAFLYGVEDYRPSAKVKQISAQIASDSGMGEVSDNAPPVTAGGSGGGTAQEAKPPETTPAQETTPEETSVEETTLEETPEETSDPADEETETSAQTEPEEELGPGIGLDTTAPMESGSGKPEPSFDEETTPKGPGSSLSEETAATPEMPGLTPGNTDGPGSMVP